MRLFPALLVAVLGLALAGCYAIEKEGWSGNAARYDGPEASRTDEPGAFVRLEVSSAVRATVTAGPTARVVLHAPKDLLPRIRFVREGDTLRFESDGPYSTRGEVRAEITVPSLAAVEASGASRVTVRGLPAGALEVEASGASEVTWEGEARPSRLTASGASTIRLGGTSEDLRVEASGASRLELAGLRAERASVEASGASRVTIGRAGTGTLSASGASEIAYGEGSPSEDASGASRVSRGPVGR